MPYPLSRRFSAAMITSESFGRAATGSPLRLRVSLLSSFKNPGQRANGFEAVLRRLCPDDATRGEDRGLRSPWPAAWRIPLGRLSAWSPPLVYRNHRRSVTTGSGRDGLSPSASKMAPTPPGSSDSGLGARTRSEIPRFAGIGKKNTPFRRPRPTCARKLG